MTDTLGTDLGEGRVIRDSGKAILVELTDSGKQVWIPKSVIHDDSEVYEDGTEGIVIVKTWFAEKNDLP